jgi:hypothetical protein
VAGLTSLAGLFFLPELNVVEGFFHVAVGLIFAYVGFLQGNAAVARSVVGGLGVLLLVGKGVILGAGLLFAGRHDLFNPLEVICLVVGIASVLAARYLADEDRMGARG